MHTLSDLVTLRWSAKDGGWWHAVILNDVVPENEQSFNIPEAIQLCRRRSPHAPEMAPHVGSHSLSCAYVTQTKSTRDMASDVARLRFVICKAEAAAQPNTNSEAIGGGLEVSVPSNVGAAGCATCVESKWKEDESTPLASAIAPNVTASGSRNPRTCIRAALCALAPVLFGNNQREVCSTLPLRPDPSRSEQLSLLRPPWTWPNWCATLAFA